MRRHCCLVSHLEVPSSILDATGEGDSGEGTSDQNGRVKTKECLTTSVVKERKLSRVETAKDGSAKVIETVHRTQEERRIEIEH